MKRRRKMRSNCPRKYCVEHAKHASKVYLETDNCNHRIIKLKNNSLFKRGSMPFDGKGSEGLKLAIVSVVKGTGGSRAKLPSSRWRRSGRSLREVFACSRLFATTDLSQIYNREARRHGTPCTKTTDSYPFSFLYNNPRKIRRETTVG